MFTCEDLQLDDCKMADCLPSYKAGISNKRGKADFKVGNLYFFITNISEGKAFLLQGLKYN